MAASFYKHFMDPALDDLQASIDKGFQEIREVQDKLQKEDEEKRGKVYLPQVPVELREGSKDTDAIYQQLSALYEDAVGSALALPMPSDSINEASQAAKLGAGLASHFRARLDSSAYRELTAAVHNQVHDWLSQLFRFKSSQMFHHDRFYEAINELYHLLVKEKYPRMSDEGYEAMHNRPPVIYLSSVFGETTRHVLLDQLHLPPCSVVLLEALPETEQINVEKFEEKLGKDMAGGRLPLMLVGFAGTPAFGQLDEFHKLSKLCKKHAIWLHACGTGLSLLPLTTAPSHTEAVFLADSLTLDLAHWFDLPGTEYYTLHTEVLGVRSSHMTRLSSLLPLWCALHSSGGDALVERVKQSTVVADQFTAAMKKLPGMTIVTPTKLQLEGKKPKTWKGMLVEFLLNLREVPHVVVFQYRSDLVRDASVNAAGEMPDGFWDTLTRWLVDSSVKNVDRLKLEPFQSTTRGVCGRFSPLEQAAGDMPTADDITALCTNMRRQIGILEATMKLREKLAAAVAQYDVLTNIRLPKWAGLGAVRYVPAAWGALSIQLPEMSRQQVNLLNERLIETLKEQDSAFSTGWTQDKEICLRFGLVTAETNLEELVANVYRVGQELEREREYTDTLAELVTKGIEDAEHDLEKEHEEQLGREGFLRQVPLVASVVNWWSPLGNESKGRSLDLNFGTLKSTQVLLPRHPLAGLEAHGTEDSQGAGGDDTAEAEKDSGNVSHGEDGGGDGEPSQVKAAAASPPASTPTSPAPVPAT